MAAAITGIEDTSLRALAKLEQVLPARLRPRVTALSQAVVTLPVAHLPDSPRYLAYRLMLLPRDYTLLGPPELAGHLAEVAERAARYPRVHRGRHGSPPRP